MDKLLAQRLRSLQGVLAQAGCSRRVGRQLLELFPLFPQIKYIYLFPFLHLTHCMQFPRHSPKHAAPALHLSSPHLHRISLFSCGCELKAENTHALCTLTAYYTSLMHFPHSTAHHTNVHTINISSIHETWPSAITHTHNHGHQPTSYSNRLKP